jgi:hypothetical protein
MKQVASSLLLLSVALLMIPSEILCKKSKKTAEDLNTIDNSNTTAESNSQMSTKSASSSAVANAPVPTAHSALAKAKHQATVAGNAYNLDHDIDAIRMDLQHDLESLLEKVQTELGHGANAHAGAVYEESLTVDAQHPAHKDHADVKKAIGAVQAAKKGSEAIATKAVDHVKSIADSAKKLAKTADDSSHQLGEQMAAQAKTNTNAATGMATALAKSNIDREAAANLATANAPEELIDLD